MHSTEGRLRAGVDIGGTFTDLILVDDVSGQLTVGKVLTTPADPAAAVADVLTEALRRAQAAPQAVHHVIHGTTLVTNAVIERKGARTALLTTRGFRDAYEIAREHRYDLYDLFLEMPTPLVPRYLRLEVDERVHADGTVARAPDAQAIAQLVAELRDKDIEAIAVCFLHRSGRSTAPFLSTTATCSRLVPRSPAQPSSKNASPRPSLVRVPESRWTRRVT